MGQRRDLGVGAQGRVLRQGFSRKHVQPRSAQVATVECGQQGGFVHDGATRTEETESPTALIGELATRLGGEVPNLTVARPTLEDTYLSLVDVSREEVQA